jgi:predicted ABC-type ATPase
MQKHFLETEADAKDFMAMMRDKIDGRNPDNIINMDQIPVTFSYHSNKTLDIKGTKTIHTRMSTSDTKHITLVSTVTASGNILLPYLIFKGKPNGCIVSWEFSTFPAV